MREHTRLYCVDVVVAREKRIYIDVRERVRHSVDSHTVDIDVYKLDAGWDGEKIGFYFGDFVVIVRGMMI